MRIGAELGYYQEGDGDYVVITTSSGVTYEIVEGATGIVVSRGDRAMLTADVLSPEEVEII